MTKAIKTTYEISFEVTTPIDEINKALNIDFERDVKDYFVKWGTLHLKMKDGAYKEYRLHTLEISSDYVKYPDDVEMIDLDV